MKTNKIIKCNYLNSAKIVEVWASKEAKLINYIAFFCSEFMLYLEFRF